MGVETRKKPALPAPTDSSFNQTSGDENPVGTELDVATDLSRRTDRTSYSIPDDGSPVTIDTKKTTAEKTKKSIIHGRNKSQTSLLIEYFEGGKGDNVTARPSVRVKVRPSSAKKGKEGTDHIQITEDGGKRKPSYTRRISLGRQGSAEQVQPEDRSVTDSTISGRRAPIDIEVINKEGSDLSAASASNRNEEYIPINPSEISSMPPDSMLEGNPAPLTPKRTRSRSLTRGERVPTTGINLKAPVRSRSRSLSKERLTEKVMERLRADKPRGVAGSSKKASSRSRSASKEHLETISSPKRRSGSGKHSKGYEDIPSGDQSVLSGSQVSDRRSFLSGTSGKSSLNNPKLLETVEDAIRRLILPELTALKQEQKTQKNREKFEKVHRDSTTSISGATKAELSRSLSKHASDPNLAASKPKVVLNRDENDPGVTLSGDSVKKKKKSRTSREGIYPESTHDRSFERGMSEETVIRDDGKSPRRRSKDHKTRDVIGAGIAGGLIGQVLTQEALKHHDSKSSVASIEKRERRRRRSKSHSRSRSNSIAATDEIFNKADVPPMPMRSELTNSDLTRESILSERTSTPTSEARQMEIRQAARGSPRGLSSPKSGTSTKSPKASKTLDSYYRNDERDDYGYKGSPLEHEIDYSDTSAAAAAMGAAAGYWGSKSAGDPYGSAENIYDKTRGLSPIQSVASMEEREEQRHQGAGSGSNASAADLPDHSGRPKGISLESGDEILGSHDLRSNASLPRDPHNDSWYEHEKSEQNRDSNDSYGSKVDVRHLTNYTDDSMDAPYLDKVTAAQQIRGIGNNAEFVHTPMAVESAVASLHDSSIVDGKSVNSGGSKLGRLDSPSAERHFEEAEYYERPVTRDGPGSPLKKELSIHEHDTFAPSPDKSPYQSDARSLGEYSDKPIMTASAIPRLDDDMPAYIGEIKSQTSEISTNPSIIRGPMGNSLPEYQHTSYNSASPIKENHDNIKAAAQHMMEAAANAGSAAALVQATKSKDDQTLSKDIGSYQNEYIPRDSVYPSVNDVPQTPDPPHRDEGYISDHPRPGSGARTPDYRRKDLYSDKALAEIMGKSGPDPFTGPGHTRNFSGNSHGMMSPLYDSATGQGIDKIQSKDIVALMDHLTVRDAQRNARDTEILVTLVRSAAEMRNSFEDMKKFIEDQDNFVMEVNNKQHEKTQRVIGGPRPLPPSSSKLARGSSADDIAEDVPQKKRNMFRRALKGLGGRSNNDLVKIEDMLHHLLEEVAELKANQGVATAPAAARRDGLSSYEALRDAPPDGYEPEGDAGTGSADQSGYFSNSSSRQLQTQPGYGRRSSGNRVSTVLEHEEEDLEDSPLNQHEQDALEYENNDDMLTPTREMPRGGSLPPGTPPTMNVTGPSNASNENTPRTDKSNKKGHHKSSSSSFGWGKSRWSKTTASSGGENRNSTNTRKERPLSEVSRLGSDLPDFGDHFDPEGDDRIRSQTSLNADPARAPSPLVPSAVSENKYQYRAHRDSINLQHPRPRAGPAVNHLESAVRQSQAFGSPVSPTSDQWGSNPALARFGGGAGNRLSGGTGPHLSPISDTLAESREGSIKNKGPPRPPKIPDDSPLVPEKSNLSSVGNQDSSPQQQGQFSVPRKPTFAERAGNGVQFHEPNGQISSPGGGTAARTFSGGVTTTPPSRKPTGPRPQVGSGNWSNERLNPPRAEGTGQLTPGGTGVQRTRYRGSPNAIPDYDSGEDETF